MSDAKTVWLDQRHSGRMSVESQLQEALACDAVVLSHIAWQSPPGGGVWAMIAPQRCGLFL